MTTVTRVTRDEAIARIRTALRKRSGKAWSVTGGRGTAWGWIEINSPPARRTAHERRKPGSVTNRPEDYEIVDTGALDGYMTDSDRAELASLLGLPNLVHHQGVSIADGSDYRQEYTDRAEGRTPAVIGSRYWD